MRNELFKILDGIVSDSEFCDENLSSADNVINYAEAAGYDIGYDEAQKIIEVGKAWLHEQVNGNGEWGRMRDEAEAALA